MAGRALQSEQKLGNGQNKPGSVINAWQEQKLLSKASRFDPEALDLFSFPLSGYLVSFSGGRDVRT